MIVNGDAEKLTGQFLNEKWDVGARHALYSKNGNWFHQLESFPGAYFDPEGYVLFRAENDYRNHTSLLINETVHVPDGIASLPEYILATTLIIDDDDTVEDEISGSIYPYDMPKEVDIREEPQTVFEWLRKLNRGKLEIDPEFQRNLVWKPSQKSLFIESVLLNIPLPPLYVNQSQDGKYIIVDGLQRTTTLNEFVENKFPLKNLKVLTELNHKRFSDLDEAFQTKIEDKKLFVYVIKPSVPLPMVYDIFHRINTGGTQLTRQEIRNCFYIGSATRFLKGLSEQESFRKAIDYGISPRRMKDREAVLRFLAFRILDYASDYKNDMDAFLGVVMTRMNKMSETELDHFRNEFERVMKYTYEFFGNKNFRWPTRSSRGRINIAILESVSYFFAEQTDSFLQANQEKIVENFQKLLTDDEYTDAVRFATGDTRRVKTRFDRAQAILGDV